MLNVKGRYAIAGIGDTAVGKLPEITTLGLTLQAVHRALADAGLRPIAVYLIGMALVTWISVYVASETLHGKLDQAAPDERPSVATS